MAIDMSRLVVMALVAFAAGTIYFVNLLLRKRREMDELPCPPMKSRLFGHLDIADECMRVFPPEYHFHNALPYIQKKYGQGDCFYIDWWPLGPRWLFISNPELASQYVTTTNSLPKSSLETIYIDKFLGKNNMVSIEGSAWKHTRSIYNPGFSASHLMTLTPYIVDASVVFCDVMYEKAKTNELFLLEDTATRLTIDIIGKVVLDADFDSQKARHPIVDTFRERANLMGKTNPVMDISKFELWREFKFWLNGRRLDQLLGQELDRKMAERRKVQQTPKSFKERKRSVVDLAMDAYMANQNDRDSEKLVSSSSMDKTFRQNAIDNMKTFIFAGHDTTASTIAYLFYMLHFHPQVHKKMVDELDAVFGSRATTASIAATIKEDAYIINQLEYVTAVIKETLRVFPPASTLRHLPEEKDPNKIVYMTHPETGQKLPLSGFDIWPAVLLVARNEAFFPKPEQFIPERFIPSMTPFPESKLFTPAGKDAWRPFEKGPRNCIGQELAMIETKIILALSVKFFDFVAEYDGVRCESIAPIETYKEFADGIPGKERLTVEGHRCYQILKGAAKPCDSMPGRMSLRQI